ncbi:MAG: hypothetical protein WC810_03095 [Janthinobacterium sp.]
MDTKVNEISINGIVYVPKSTQQEKEIVGDIKIVILQRGWVMVGRLERNNSNCKLHNAAVIRSWGTTKGLGEIAKNGPTDKTFLDKTYGVVEFDYLTVVASITCEVSKWINKL